MSVVLPRYAWRNLGVPAGLPMKNPAYRYWKHTRWVQIIMPGHPADGCFVLVGGDWPAADQYNSSYRQDQYLYRPSPVVNGVLSGPGEFTLISPYVVVNGRVNPRRPDQQPVGFHSGRKRIYYTPGFQGADPTPQPNTLVGRVMSLGIDDWLWRDEAPYFNDTVSNLGGSYAALYGWVDPVRDELGMFWDSGDAILGTYHLDTKKWEVTWLPAFPSGSPWPHSFNSAHSEPPAIDWVHRVLYLRELRTGQIAVFSLDKHTFDRCTPTNDGAPGLRCADTSEMFIRASRLHLMGGRIPADSSQPGVEAPGTSCGDLWSIALPVSGQTWVKEAAGAGPRAVLCENNRVLGGRLWTGGSDTSNPGEFWELADAGGSGPPTPPSNGGTTVAKHVVVGAFPLQGVQYTQGQQPAIAAWRWSVKDSGGAVLASQSIPYDGALTQLPQTDVGSVPVGTGYTVVGEEVNSAGAVVGRSVTSSAFDVNPDVQVTIVQFGTATVSVSVVNGP